MAKKTSAGILLFRREPHFELFLVHPGGPFWAKKDAGSWSIPKGEFEDSEDPLDAAIREFGEETGQPIDGDFIPLEPLKQKSGKLIYAWALEGDCDTAKISSNTFTMEWPPKSGKMQDFPEIDRAEWFAVAEAKTRILAGQLAFVEQLVTRLGIDENAQRALEPKKSTNPQGSLF